MTSVTAASPTPQAGSTNSDIKPPQASGTQLNSDFETFLKMMTTQMQNQDPMNPMESTEFATQLAQFSSVEQQVLTNDTLKEISAAFASNSLQQMGSLVGMEGLAPAPVLFTGQLVSMRPAYAEDATRSELVVRNSDGDVVDRMEIPVGQETLYWNGTLEDGSKLPNGVYKFEIENFEGNEQLDTKPAMAYNQILEVRDDNGTVKVRLSDGSEMDASQIQGLRAPTTLS
jgi:flagellar basal-body rod modification protein FlgD